MMTLFSTSICNAQAEPPSVKLFSAPLMSPGQAWSYYGVSTTHTNTAAAWDTRPPEIKELARSLGAGLYNADEFAASVYEYVRNNIEVDFRFGLSKGARGALIDQSGSPFDQAHLMVELLREGNAIANYNLVANYRVGTISLTAAQFTAWTGLTDRRASCQFLADGGIPATINGTTDCVSLAGNLSTSGTPVVMSHIWVRAYDSGNPSSDFLYDPSYKTGISYSGSDLALGMACGNASAPTCGSTILGYVPSPLTLSGTTVKYVEGVNRVGLESQLTAFATALLDDIRTTDASNYQTTNPNMQIEDLVGGLVIDTAAPLSITSVLPYPATHVYEWTGDIPDQFRTTITIQVDNVNQLIYADESAGRRLRFWQELSDETPTSYTRKVTLYSEYRPLASSEVPNQVSGHSPVNITVNHPYSALSGSYLDESITSKIRMAFHSCELPQPAGNCGSSTVWVPVFATIVVGFGNSSEATVKHLSSILETERTSTVAENPSDPKHIWYARLPPAPFLPTGCQTYNFPPPATPTTNECFEPHQSIYGATWLAESSALNRLVSQINKVRVQHHHSAGTIYSLVTGGVISDLQSAYSVNSTTSTPLDRTTAFVSIAVVSNRLEGGAPQQINDDSRSTDAVALLSLANENNIRLMEVDSSNYASAQLTNYTGIANDTLQEFMNAGFSAIVPQNAHAGLMCTGCISLNYGGLAAFNSSQDRIGFIVGGLAKGAGAATDVDPLQSALDSVKLADYSTKGRQRYGVDLASGNLTLSPPPDLVTGDGAFPRSLSVQRHYTSADVAASCNPDIVNSCAIFQRFGLPGGWRQKFAIDVEPGNDAFASFGRRSAMDAARTVAAIYVIRDLSASTDLRSRVALVFAADWFGKGLWNNIVKVSRPPQTNIFVRLPDGSFNPEPGSHEKLTEVAGRSLGTMFPSGTSYSFDPLTYTLQNKDGSEIRFDHKGGNSFAPNYAQATQWTFADGVVIDFNYHPSGNLALVSNNLGRSISFNEGNEIESTGVWATDDSGRNVKIYVTANTSANWGDKRFLSDFSVETPDGAITKYEYAQNPATQIYRPYSRIQRWFSATDLSTPFLSVDYDNFYRVKGVRDNLVPQNVTNYFVSSLYGTENWKSGLQIDPTPLAGVTKQYFDRNGLVRKTVDALGHVFSTDYDTDRRRFRVTSPEGDFVQYKYDVRHNKTEERRVAKPGSGIADIVTSTAYIEGPTVTSCVNQNRCNKPYTIIDPMGNTTTFAYNTSGFLTSITEPFVTGGVPVSTIGYVCTNHFGRPCTITDPEGTATAFTYNSLANYGTLQTVVADSGGLNQSTSITYDAIGNVDTVTDPRGNVSAYKFDFMRRLKWVKTPDPDGAGSRLPLVTVYNHDDDGLLIRVDQRSNSDVGTLLSRTETDYTVLGQPEYTYNQECFTGAGVRNPVLPGCGVVHTSYDALGRVDIVTDPENRQSKTVYDAAGQTLKVIRGLGTALQQDYQTYTYTPNGIADSLKDANGNLTRYFFDGFDRLEKTEFPDKTNVGVSNNSDYELYMYDVNGNLTSKRTRQGDFIVSQFDALNREERKEDRIASETGTVQNRVDYGYDLVGRQTDVSQSDGYAITRIYDALGRVDQTTDNGRVIDYGYDAAGNRIRMDYPGTDGFYVTYDYDDQDRLTFIREKGSAALATYAYDDQSRRQTLTLGNGRIIDYDYYADSTIDRIQHLDLLGVGAHATWDFGYNAANQVTSKILPSQFDWDAPADKTDTYAPNGLNQYATINSQVINYDGNGSLTSDGVWNYSYDVENRLKTAAKSGISATYDYDPLGRRARKSGTGVVTEVYLNDGVEEIADYNGSGTLLRRYVHGLGIDERLVMYTGTSLSSKEYYHTDHQGSSIAMSSNTGTLLDEYTYSAFGEPGAEGLTGNPFRYAGRRLDAESGLYYYRARYYSPALGRFLQTDPIGYGDNMNMYAYVGNDPVNGIDPMGLAGDCAGAATEGFSGGCTETVDPVTGSITALNLDSLPTREVANEFFLAGNTPDVNIPIDSVDLDFNFDEIGGFANAVSGLVLGSTAAVNFSESIRIGGTFGPLIDNQGPAGVLGNLHFNFDGIVSRGNNIFAPNEFSGSLGAPFGDLYNFDQRPTTSFSSLGPTHN